MDVMGQRVVMTAVAGKRIMRLSVKQERCQFRCALGRCPHSMFDALQHEGERMGGEADDAMFLRMPQETIGMRACKICRPLVGAGPSAGRYPIRNIAPYAPAIIDR